MILVCVVCSLPIPGDVGVYWHPLQRILGLPLLSSSLNKKPLPEDVHLHSDVPHFIATSIPHLQRFLYSKRGGTYVEIRDRVNPYLPGFK